jgi:lipoprotein-releasing system permease protein
MRIAIYFLNRYFRSPRQEWRRSGSIFMVLGIIISVATLTIAFTIFDGYQRVLKSSILSTNSHIYIFNNSRDNLTEADVLALRDYLEKQPQIEVSSPVVLSQAMAAAGREKKNTKVISCQIRGIDWEQEKLPITYREYVIRGNWQLREDNEVVIGEQMAQRLGLDAGDIIYLVSPAQSRISMMGLQSQSKPFVIVGLYHSGIYDSDSRVVFMQPERVWDFSNQPGRYSRLEVKLKEEFIDSADYLAYIWLNQLDLDYQILTWQDFNSSLFDLLELEKWVLFFILSFLIVVASFNVVSSVTTEIIDRRRDIGILRAMGFSGGSIKRILLGRIVGTGFLAIIAGLITGMLLSWFASVQNFFRLKGDVYFLDKINVHFSLPALALILITAFAIIFLAAALPLRRLNRLEITGILRS